MIQEYWSYGSIFFLLKCLLYKEMYVSIISLCKWFWCKYTVLTWGEEQICKHYGLIERSLMAEASKFLSRDS